jgi:hypothetical protein
MKRGETKRRDKRRNREHRESKKTTWKCSCGARHLLGHRCPMGWSQNDSFTLFRTPVAYNSQYANDEWTPLAPEKEFSKVLYED